MPLGILTGLARTMRRKRTSLLDNLSSKRAPRNYNKGKNCKPTGFHTRKGGYVLVQEKLPSCVVPDLTDFKLKPYVLSAQLLLKPLKPTTPQQSRMKTDAETFSYQPMFLYYFIILFRILFHVPMSSLMIVKSKHSLNPKTVC